MRQGEQKAVFIAKCVAAFRRVAERDRFFFQSLFLGPPDRQSPPQGEGFGKSGLVGGTEPGVDFREPRGKPAPQGADQTAADRDRPDLPAALERQERLERFERLVARALNEPAGVENDQVGVFRLGRELPALLNEPAEDRLTVDQVLLAYN